MITAEKHLHQLVEAGTIEESDALRWVNSLKDFLMERTPENDSEHRPG